MTVCKHCKDIGWLNIKITLIEAYPCNAHELLKHKRYWYDSLKPTLDSQKPSRSIIIMSDMKRKCNDEKAKKDYMR